MKGQTQAATRLIDARLVFTVIAAGLSLVLDALTPLGFAIWIVQVVLVWLTSLWANRRQILAVWVVCSISIVLGFCFSDKTGFILWVDISNMILGLAAIAAITHTSLRRRAEEDARRKAQEAAMRAEAALRYQELKRLLLETVAHKVQTPLTCIRAGISALLADSHDSDHREWLTIMDEETTRLSSAVNDTVYLGHIEAGSAALDKQPHTIHELVYSALESNRLTSGQFEFDLPTDLPIVDVDARLLQLTIRLVVDDALMNTPSGTPVSVSACAKQGAVVLSVSDRGPCLSMHEQACIEAKSVRPDEITPRLARVDGLSIARQAIEMHGGSLLVQSPAGIGTTVSFRLPVSSSTRD